MLSPLWAVSGVGMSLQGENVIWQYWETRGEKPKFIDGLHDIAKKNSGVKVILVTPETLKAYLPNIEDDVHRITDLSHKADMIRTRLVMTYGGMWLDSDAVVLSDLNWLFDYLKEYEFVGFNDAGRLQAERPWVRVNCFVSRPNGTVVSEWVRLQNSKFPRTTFNWSEIGASLLNPICLSNKQRVKILPFGRISPIPCAEVAAFVAKNDEQATRILNECYIVMLCNQGIVRQPLTAGLLQLTVEEIAAGDYVLARIFKSAFESTGADNLQLFRSETGPLG
jgi:hypothetical protein